MVRGRSPADRLGDGLNGLILLALAACMLYPLVHVLTGSLSDPLILASYKGVLLYPHGFTLRAYELVFRNPNIITGYRNTLIVVVAATSLNLVMTSLGAFLLSRPRFAIRKLLTVMVVITMYFGGGLIPRFLVYKNLYHLYDTLLALIIPGAISTWNLIIMRTSFLSVPPSLEESAKIDGAGEVRILIDVILPLSKAVLAVMVLFYGVAHWNAWFDAMVFLRSRELFPLQLILRELLITQQRGAGTDEVELLAENLKYATIIVATVPILCIYPFIQRYFVQGVMVGAIKG
jgi:putative aldouronate transport system permease protein